MKQLTQEEKEAYTTRPLSKMNPVRALLMRMKPGDIYLIEASEWHWKSATPAYLCRRVEEKTSSKFTVEKALHPKTGWIIVRVS
ncbi:MAG: hypothetical protein AB7G44_15145 [Bacteroidia bacterium]